MNDDLKNRFRNILKDDDSSSDDIFTIWDQQKRMKAEDERIAREIQEAKKRAKELKRTLRSHQLGEKKNSIVDKLRKIDFNKLIPDKVPVKNITSLPNKKRLTFAGLVAVVIIAGVVSALFKSSNNQTGTLGESSTRIPIPEELPREKPSDFTLLIPAGVDESELDIVRISPEGSDPSYTYLDRFTEDGTIFRVTQQKKPDNFDLTEVATEFQATNIIQVDDVQVYHGYSEKGGVQSLIFIKENNLFTIRSSQKFTDDQWASYVASLQ